MHDADNCQARDYVTPRPYSTSSAGHRCLATGSRCIPGDRCAALEQEHIQSLEANTEIESFAIGSTTSILSPAGRGLLFALEDRARKSKRAQRR